MKTEPNALAFPADNDIPNLHQGLSKREYFAAMAMQGLLASGKYAEGIAIAPHLGQLSTEAADALIKALNETQP